MKPATDFIKNKFHFSKGPPNESLYAIRLWAKGPQFNHIILYLLQDSMIDFDSNCLNNEPNFFKKHSCDDNKEASFLYRAARKLKQFLKMNISDDFNLHLSTVSQGTLTLLNCTSKVS
ncbi:hypothetical protein J1605_001799 [Eschrichtius robustus]|uniref:Interleukin-7 n=1 Tax=Eschrichtius robustus TaxID=9764 RepID=A0AB34I0C6_ESCRO|nr:hypothetical protein J1605_001799 [Eschrichtius robustus]